MERHIALAHPEALQIVGPEGPTWGADQDWYRTFWQQRAGCGPTTASEQLAYVARIRHIPALCPLEILRREPFVDYMEQVWDYVTPGHKGLNKVSMFTDGVERFAASRGVALTARALEVPAGEGRPGLPACLDFVITHELVHLMEPSHNKRFHMLLDCYCPENRALAALLRTNARTVAMGQAHT